MTVTPRALFRMLKIASVAGLAIHAFIFVILILGVIFSFDLLKRVEVWVAFWGAFSLGLPLYGILYVLVKLREYARDRHASLSKQET